MTQRTLSLALVGLATLPAMAGGFLLKEQSPRAQGLSYAGITAARGTGAMYFNPASLGSLKGREATLGLSFVAPGSEFVEGQASRTVLVPASLRGVDGGPSHGNAARSAVLPALGAAWSLGDRVVVGLAVNVPFGMVTEYEAGWVGRYHALKSSLKTVDIAPTLAWRFHPQWSLGVAFVARHAEAELTSAVDFGTLGALRGIPGLVPGKADGEARLKGDTWSYGTRLGLAWEPREDLRLGLGYQSATSGTLKGDATYQRVPGPLAQAFGTTGIEADMSLPSSLSLGAEWAVSSRLSLHGEVAHTGWSTFKELRVRFANGQPDNLTDEHWHDTLFGALGATWKVDDRWTLRTGLAYDEGAAPDSHRTPRIPDGNRLWVSLGAGLQVTDRLALDAAYSHIFVSDGPLDLNPTATAQTTHPDFLRGSLRGSTRNKIDILAVQASWRF